MKIGIIGLGLIGGSLAKALRKRFNASKIVAVNRNEDVLKTACGEGVIDCYDTEVSDIFTDCRIIFICTPVDKIFEYIEKLTPFVDKDCILTDVGSTKGNLCQKVFGLMEDVCFIGGHPMTGSEKTRYTFSKEHLFENSYYILTPDVKTPLDQIRFMENMAAAIGAIPIVMPADVHDFVMSYISHVPHIAAAALVNLARGAGNGTEEFIYKLAAGGFKDTTRIASSNPEIWQSISFENKKEILQSMDFFIELLSQFKNFLLHDNFENIFHFFQTAKEFRDNFANQRAAGALEYEIKIDVLDTPGIIAKILTVLSQNNINIKNIGIVNSREYEGGILRIAFANETDKTSSIAILKNLEYDID